MAFLNPLVLIGLIAAAIPLIIHLFNFRKPKRVDFSSLTFLRELEKTTMRRVRIKQWLLLLLRTLAIASLVLAFARPTKTSMWDGVVGERTPSAMAIVLDNSMSMSMRDVQGAYIDQAKALASALMEAAHTGDELFLVPLNEKSEGALWTDPRGEAVQDAILEIQPQFGDARVPDGIAQAVNLLEQAENPRRELFIVSDLQRSTFVDSSRTVVTGDIELTLMPLGERRHNNVAVTDVQLQSQILEVGRPVEVAAEIISFGSDEEQYSVSVFLEGERVAQTSVELESGVPSTADLVFSPPRSGWLHGEVQIEHDEAEWDDVRHFVLHVPETRRVLLVRGSGARTDLVSIALNVASERGSVQIVGMDESALQGADLNEFAAVVLIGVAGFSSEEEAMLEEYVQLGGGLVLFPGEVVQAPNNLLGALNGGGFTEALGEREGVSIGGFGTSDLEHPVFAGLFERSADDERIESPDIFFAGSYERGSGSESTLIQLAGGTPFLQEIRPDNGRVLVFAVAPDPSWSDFPMRGLFAPLLYRSVTYVSSGNDMQTASETESTAFVQLTQESNASTLRVVGPDGVEVVPPQRTVQGGVIIDLGGDLRQPGVVDVMHGDQVVKRIALNGDPQESDLAVLDHDEAVELLESATGQSVRLLDASGGAGVEAAEQLKTERAGVDLSWIFLAIALACLVGEMFVAMRWRRS